MAGALAATERKLVAVATKLVTCPALLVLDQPLSHFNQPRDATSAAHMLQSLRTAASQLHINIIMAEPGLQDVSCGAVDNMVMLDEQALPVYAGTCNKARLKPSEDIRVTWLTSMVLLPNPSHPSLLHTTPIACLLACISTLLSKYLSLLYIHMC